MPPGCLTPPQPFTSHTTACTDPLARPLPPRLTEPSLHFWGGFCLVWGCQWVLGVGWFFSFGPPQFLPAALLNPEPRPFALKGQNICGETAAGRGGGGGAGRQASRRRHTAAGPGRGS